MQVENVSLTCPLCRKRVGLWYRKRSKDEKLLIDTKLWKIIKKNFPKEVKANLEEKETGLVHGLTTDEPNPFSFKHKKQTPCAAAPNMEYKRCSFCIPGLGALTGYYQPGQLNPVLVDFQEDPNISTLRMEWVIPELHGLLSHMKMEFFI
ncbi:RNF168 [Cordylochernes scorpioides]|uniref:RNF168 n=1 Tax=Cordylochernes scorpioides TaxID=51811 RepID=A0ABY6LU57_9ARAC|nr:RNF168 [Cordylochernes scorpioides]